MGGFPFQRLGEVVPFFADLVNFPHLLDGQFHGAGLLGEGVHDGLADPPDRVGDELDVAGGIEPFGGLDQADVALLDQILKRQAAPPVFVGDRNHIFQISAHQIVQGFHIAPGDFFSQLGFFFPGQRFDFADLPQIVVQGVAGRIAIPIAAGSGFVVVLFGGLPRGHDTIPWLITSGFLIVRGHPGHTSFGDTF